ncbi:MAG TPA: fumarylacetoacetase [Acidimicrobiia bacterium]|nr:fumarylacetoacetase [Acidimicrobiia bacterium]
MTSHIPVPEATEFPLDNLPYGVFESGVGPHLAVAVGDHLVDLHVGAAAGLLPHREALTASDLNPLLAMGRSVWDEVRAALIDLLTGDRLDRLPAAAIRERAKSTMLLPFHPGGFVDFYSSLHHATNLGRMFRPGDEPLNPNWRSLPVAYNGRASSVVVSGTPVRRPRGQVGPGSEAVATAALDFELEVGFVTGPGNPLGESIPAPAAADHIFGLVLVNDWSARDIQRWEYVPLGPFLGKSFATTVSPWVVPLAALAPYLIDGPRQEPPPAQYLRAPGQWAVDVDLEVGLTPPGGAEQVITRVGFASMYWNMAQQLAHVTINGTNVQPGDLYGSGTVSGPEPGTWGSLIEITRNGAEPLRLADGSQRTFLGDGDTVTIRGRAQRPGLPRIGFGECVGTILPAAPPEEL